MLSLVLIVVLFAVILAVLLWIGSVWFQGYIYSEPVSKAHWRAMAAAGALTLFIGFWCFLNYRNPGRFPGQFQFTASDDKQLTELWAVREGKETYYRIRKTARGMPEYVDKENRPWQQRPDAIVIQEEKEGEKVRFEADRDSKGKFKAEAGRSLRYVDPKGRVMTEERLGQLTIPRRGILFGNIFLNLFHLVAWFLALWLILRFQWSHALGLAFVIWLIMTFSILHLILVRVEEQGQLRPAVTAAWRSDQAGLASIRDHHERISILPSLTLPGATCCSECA